MSWYQKTPERTLEELNSNLHGLTLFEVSRRLLKYGYNKLPEEKSKTWFEIFLRQFQSPIIYILLVAAFVVFLLGEIADASIIFIVLFINAVIGAIQEGRAENTLKALKNLVATNSTVIREGDERVISDFEVVPGDIILLREGDKVPADARIIESNLCQIDEASITGESKPVSKIIQSIEIDNLDTADQKNMVFKGTYVLGGEAKAVVVETGIDTVIGAISIKLKDIDTDVPLKASIQALSKVIIWSVLCVSIFIFIIGLVRGNDAREMFATVVAISVSVIPEGLPIVVTVVLTAGIHRMSRRNILIKKLQAVEALGQAKVIAVDKTGTVTLNQMMVEKIYVDGETLEVSGNGYVPEGRVLRNSEIIKADENDGVMMLGKISALVSLASVAYSDEKKEWIRLSGDPTDAAMRVFSEKLGFNKIDLELENEKILEIPFSSNTRFHGVAHKVEGKNVFSVAGSTEVILEASNHIWKKGEIKKISEEDKKEIEENLIQMMKEGLRVIALGIKFNATHILNTSELPELCFVGFVGISDSLRKEVHQSIKDAEKAGVKVVMITGDHAETAKAIAIKAGIFKEGDMVLSGKELKETPEDELIKIIPQISVFARISPEDKLRIIEIYRKRGEIVAMTGDGVNDALSLSAADLGVAMGKGGSEVAKEASDIVLMDDNFGSVVSAIEEGRNTYRTIKKVILYLFSTSFGEIFTITAAIIIGLPLPVVASQIIWLNFVTDGFLDISLALEPKGHHLLDKSLLRKRSKWIVDSLMIKRMILVGLTMMVGTLLLFSFYLPEGYTKASTVALTLLAVYQWFNAWNCRAEKQSIFHKGIFSNKYLIGATLIVILLQLMAVYNPFFQKILHTTALNSTDWIIIVSVGTSIIFVEEIRKFISRNNIFKLSNNLKV